MTTSRLRIGQLLVDARLITPEALSDVLVAQQQDSRRLGTLLVERGHISEVQLTQILSHQLSVPWVTLHKIEFSRQLLNLVPRDLAERYCLLPIYVRRVRNHGDTLYIAMDDPTNEEALRACAAYAGLAVRPMIAPPSDIRSAIRAYYGIPVAETEPPPPPPSEGAPVVTPPPAAKVGVTAARASGDAEAAGRESVNAPAARDDASAAAHGGGSPRARTLRSALHEAPAARPVSVEVPPSTREPSRPPPRAEAAATSASATPAPTAAAAGRGATQPTAESPANEVTATTASTPLAAATEAAAAEAPKAKPRARHTEEDPVIELRELRPSRLTPTTEHAPVPIPSPRGKTPRMVALTLLDGTTITLPARPAKRTAEPAPQPVEERPSEPPGGPVSNLTARDLVAALRAVADGADASAVLGDDIRWETMFAALLSALLKKHVIADWEFVEELNKLQKR